MNRTDKGLLLLRDVNHALLGGLNLAISTLKNIEAMSHRERGSLITALEDLVNTGQEAHAKIHPIH